MKIEKITSKIKTVLIANRGEIALRIQATCRTAGIETIAIYAPEDQKLSYVFNAQKAFLLPGNGSQAYLDQHAIIAIALQAQADAIHPGYGFLSENAQFAQKVLDAGMFWIGPSPKQIETLADKTQAHKLAHNNDIPTIPGAYFMGTKNTEFLRAKKFAQEIGFPVILKCAHGGGGKAIRRINSLDEFETQWQRVVSESQQLFRSETLLLEKYILFGRHIEIQIAGDGTNFIHFYERECSIQRRHQKIIEEAPANFISQSTKEKLFDAAFRLAKETKYTNIGTVEFLVTPDNQYYFLEINTRLQVEHSITELTTNTDLVLLQLYITATQSLPFLQSNISQHGHAIECRICSEDPAKGFTPSTGKITNLVFSKGPFLRIDHDLEEDLEITPLFDPMLAKITTFGPTRDYAKKTMSRVLRQSNIAGIKTNLEFLEQILKSDAFTHGKIHTNLLNDPIFIAQLIFPLNTNSELDIFSAEEQKKLISLIIREWPFKKNLQKKRLSGWSVQKWN